MRYLFILALFFSYQSFANYSIIKSNFNPPLWSSVSYNKYLITDENGQVYIGINQSDEQFVLINDFYKIKKINKIDKNNLKENNIINNQGDVVDVIDISLYSSGFYMYLNPSDVNPISVGVPITIYAESEQFTYYSISPFKTNKNLKEIDLIGFKTEDKFCSFYKDIKSLYVINQFAHNNEIKNNDFICFKKEEL